MDADQLSLRAAEHLWSIRVLALHIVAVRASWFHRWMREGGPELARFLDIDDRPEAETLGAGEITAALRGTWSSLALSLGAWTESDLDREFQSWRPSSGGERPWRTRRWIVWHVAEHDLHHGGEISLTLGMHGLGGLDV